MLLVFDMSIGFLYFFGILNSVLNLLMLLSMLLCRVFFVKGLILLMSVLLVLMLIFVL